MSDDPFETVAITYSPSQAGVIMSLFEWNGIPAYAMNLETVGNYVPLTLALGAIPIRVAREAAAEAREILTEAAPIEPDEAQPADTLADRVVKLGLMGVLGLMSVAPPPRLSAEIVR